jgi:hypothetical protein
MFHIQLSVRTSLRLRPLPHFLTLSIANAGIVGSNAMSNWLLPNPCLPSFDGKHIQNLQLKMGKQPNIYLISAYQHCKGVDSFHGILYSSAYGTWFESRSVLIPQIQNSRSLYFPSFNAAHNVWNGTMKRISDNSSYSGYSMHHLISH